MVSFKKYIILWISQSVSQLGSSMTAFALILWTYQQTHSALSVSIMSFCDYVPYIVVSIFAGTFVDHHYKKNVMLVSDCLAAFASLLILMFSLNGMLSVAFVYLFNAVIGTTTAFQNPASSVAVAKLVPENLLSNVSGMNSFSTNLIVVFSPV
ncbi:MAG TPA: MFS transporter, partial [Candidatus Avanaerovorax faecigallinarum]|nr:MFS transporter [Candidatus Avanaerovorax faecigallinarum]